MTVKGRVTAFGNQKGGVTKTSTIVNLAAALSEKGQKVVVFDLDVNCGSTRLFGVPEGINIYGTFEVMTGEEDVRDVIVKQGDLDVVLPENVHLIPAHVKLEGVEAVLREKNGPFAQSTRALVEPVRLLAEEYDWVLLDTAPSMTTGTMAAYMAAQYFVLTAVPEPLAIEGLVNAVRYIKHAQEGGNTDLELMGVVMNQVPGKMTKLSRALLEEVDGIFGEAGSGHRSRYKTEINLSTVIPALQKEGRTLFEAEPKHKLCGQYRALADEIVARFDAFEARQVAVGEGVLTPEPRREDRSSTTATEDVTEVANG